MAHTRSPRSRSFSRCGALSGAAFGFSALLLFTAPASAQGRLTDCNVVKDARVVAADGTFLGAFNDPAQRDSLLNRSGPFGNKAAATSLWNIRGPYGSLTSTKSPMNPHGGKPASIVKNGQTVGKLMRNSLRSWYEDPAKLVHRCYGFVP